MRPYTPFLAAMTVVARGDVLQPAWVISGSRNSTITPKLIRPIGQQPLGDGCIHITSSDRYGTVPSGETEIVASYLPYPGFWTCSRGTAVPPNTEDCLQVIADTFSALRDMTIDIPPDRCIQISYRSCLMYACSSACAGVDWDVDKWSQLATFLQTRCVWGRGGSGFVQQLPGGKEEKAIYRAGLMHVSNMRTMLTPPLVC